MSRSERVVERRRAPRRSPAVDEPISRVRVRAGHELVVLDVSDAGVLAEGVMRLMPGTNLDVHVVTREGRLLVRSRVVRACVCHVSADRIRYRGALAFDRPIDTSIIGYVVPDALSGSVSAQGKPYPDSSAAPGALGGNTLSA